jgi:hypothetical protein
MQQEIEKRHKEFQRNADQKRLFLHISSWYDWRFVFLLLAILSLFSALPFLGMFLSMGPEQSYDPTGMLLFLTYPFAFSVIMFWLSIKMTEKRVKQEKDWIDHLPFKLKGYPDLFVYRSYPALDISIEFERKRPDHDFFMDVFGSFQGEIQHEKKRKAKPLPAEIQELVDTFAAEEVSKEEADSYKFKLVNQSASKFNRHRRWAKKWIRKIIDDYLLAVHKEYPIKEITFVNGTSEFDFNWWEPRRRFWWIR